MKKNTTKTFLMSALPFTLVLFTGLSSETVLANLADRGFDATTKYSVDKSADQHIASLEFTPSEEAISSPRLVAADLDLGQDAATLVSAKNFIKTYKGASLALSLLELSTYFHELHSGSESSLPAFVAALPWQTMFDISLGAPRRATNTENLRRIAFHDFQGEVAAEMLASKKILKLSLPYSPDTATIPFSVEFIHFTANAVIRSARPLEVSAEDFLGSIIIEPRRDFNHPEWTASSVIFTAAENAEGSNFLDSVVPLPNRNLLFNLNHEVALEFASNKKKFRYHTSLIRRGSGIVLGKQTLISFLDRQSANADFLETGGNLGYFKYLEYSNGRSELVIPQGKGAVFTGHIATNPAKEVAISFKLFGAFTWSLAKSLELNNRLSFYGWTSRDQSEVLSNPAVAYFKPAPGATSSADYQIILHGNANLSIHSGVTIRSELPIIFADSGDEMGRISFEVTSADSHGILEAILTEPLHILDLARNIVVSASRASYSSASPLLSSGQRLVLISTVNTESQPLAILVTGATSIDLTSNLPAVWGDLKLTVVDNKVVLEADKEAEVAENELETDEEAKLGEEELEITKKSKFKKEPKPADEAVEESTVLNHEGLLFDNIWENTSLDLGAEDKAIYATTSVNWLTNLSSGDGGRLVNFKTTGVYRYKQVNFSLEVHFNHLELNDLSTNLVAGVFSTSYARELGVSGSGYLGIGGVLAEESARLAYLGGGKVSYKVRFNYIPHLRGLMIDLTPELKANLAYTETAKTHEEGSLLFNSEVGVTTKFQRREDIDKVSYAFEVPLSGALTVETATATKKTSLLASFKTGLGFDLSYARFFNFNLSYGLEVANQFVKNSLSFSLRFKL